MTQVFDLEVGNHGPVKALVGLNWNSEPAGSWRFRKRRLRGEGLVFHYLVRDEVGRDVCFATRDGAASGNNKPDIALAAAVAFSLDEGRHTVVEGLGADANGDELFWFMAVDNGRVVFGTDLIATRTEIIEAVNEHFGVAAHSGVQEQVHGTGSYLVDVDDASRESVLDLITEKAMARARLRSGLSRLVDGWGVAHYAVAAGFPIIAIGAVVMMWPSSEPVPDNKVTAEEKREMAEQEAKDNLKRVIDSVYAPVEIHDLHQVVQDQIGRLPVQQDQWEARTTACEAAQCETVFTNAGHSLPSTLEQAVGSVCELSVEPSGREAVCRQKLTVDTQPDAFESPMFGVEHRHALRDHIMQVVEAFEGESAYGFGGYGPVGFDESQMLEEREVPLRNEWELEVPLSGMEALSNTGFEGLAPVAVERFEIDWRSKTAKIGGFVFAEAE